MTLAAEPFMRQRRQQLELRGWRFSQPMRDGSDWRIVASLGRERAEFRHALAIGAEVRAVTWAGCVDELAREVMPPIAAE
jgi:hypothetical protein